MEVTKRNIIIRYIADTRRAIASLGGLEKQTTKVGSSFSNAIETAKGLAIFEIGRQAASSIQGLATRTFELAAGFEQTRLQFAQLTGDIESADQLLSDLEARSIATPFEPATLQQGAQALLNYGIEQDKVLEGVDRLGDLSLGNEERFLALADAYGKANARFKVTNETLELFQNNGIPILDLLGDTLGKSQQEIIALASSGAINFPILEEAIASATEEGGQFFGALARQSETVSGLLSTVRGAFDVLLRNIGEAFLPLAREILPPIIDGLFQLIRVARPLTETLGNGLSGTLELLRRVSSPVVDAFSRLGTAIGEIISPLGEFSGVGNIVAGALELMSNALAGFANLISRGLEIPIVRKAIVGLAAVIIRIPAVLNGVIEVTKAMGRSFVANFNLAAKNAEIFAERIKLFFGQSTQAQVDALRRQADNLRGQTTSLIGAFREGFDAVANAELPPVEESETKAIEQSLNEAGTRAGKEFSTGLSKEAKKALEDVKKAAENILDLEVSLIEDVFAQQEESARLDARRAIESLVGTPEQVERQTALIQEQLRRDLAAIAEERDAILQTSQGASLTDAINIPSLQFDQNTTVSPERQLQEQLRAIEELNLRIKEQLRDGVIEEDDAQVQLAQNNIAALKAQLNTIKLTYDERLKLKQQLVDAEIALEKQSADANETTLNERLQGTLTAFSILKDSAIEIAQEQAQGRIDALNAEVEAQQNRVSEVLEIADQGNAELLQIERDKLSALESERAKAIEQQRKLANIELAINAALNISNQILAISKAGASSAFPANLVAIATIVATLASTAASIRANNASVPTFEKGTDFFQPGAGAQRHPQKQNEYLAGLMKGERVLTVAQNKLIGGLSNDEVVNSVLALRNFRARKVNTRSLATSAINNVFNDSRLVETMKGVREDIAALRIEANLDEKGFSVAMQKRLLKKRRNRTRARRV